jgi:hypothetical protein
MIHLFMLFWNLQAESWVLNRPLYLVFPVEKKKKNKPVSVWVNAGSENGSSDGGATGTWVVA